MKRALILTCVLAISACGNDDNNKSNNTTANNTTANNTTANNTTANNTTANNTTANNTTANNTTAGDPAAVLINPDDCYAFSNEVDVPLALDGAFSATSPVWRRPHNETDICPSPTLLPDTAALVPYLAVKFCNDDAVEHFYDFEFINQDGPAGEPPLDDGYLVLYEGESVPTDARQCLHANDDVDGALDSTISEILGVSVPAGGAITVVASSFTFDASDGTGTGGYILVVTNAD